MKSKTKRQIKTDLWGWGMAMPLALGLAIFTVYPVIASFVYSFFDYNVRHMENFGLHNYIGLFNGALSRDFKHCLKVTLTYTAIEIPLGLILGYLLATFLCAKFKGNKFLIVLYYLPTLIPGVIAGSIWGDMLNKDYGIINSIISKLGFEKIAFTDATHLMASYIWMTTFNLGGGSIIWAAGISSVDKSFYEAASIDGAGAFRKFFNITIPLTTPYIFYNLVVGMIGALQLFNQPYILTGGSGLFADGALYTLEMLIYDTAFGGLNMGTASAMAWILCMIIAVLTAIAFSTNKKWVQYADD